jgi:hypothetical protein
MTEEEYQKQLALIELRSKQSELDRLINGPIVGSWWTIFWEGVAAFIAIWLFT